MDRVAFLLFGIFWGALGASLWWGAATFGGVFLWSFSALHATACFIALLSFFVASL